MDWKIDLKDPGNTKLNAEIIRQNLTNLIINAHENNILYPYGNITIKEGILSYTFNSSFNDSIEKREDLTINFEIQLGYSEESIELTLMLLYRKKISTFRIHGKYLNLKLFHCFIIIIFNI